MKSLKWLLISSLAVSYVMVGSGSKTIHAEHNNIEFIQIKEGETIPLYKLKGTSLEGKEVKIIFRFFCISFSQISKRHHKQTVYPVLYIQILFKNQKIWQ